MTRGQRFVENVGEAIGIGVTGFFSGALMAVVSLNPYDGHAYNTCKIQTSALIFGVIGLSGGLMRAVLNLCEPIEQPLEQPRHLRRTR